ncbi:hypothetical protein M3Y94_00614900 [Aphelenchoides besseyi]|nr:hypothetical protein M3Y94_00614900 [Aphelenchoides besseyi]
MFVAPKRIFFIPIEQLVEFADGLPLLLLLNIRNGKAEALETRNDDPEVFAHEPVQSFIHSYFTTLTQPASYQANSKVEKMEIEAESIESTDPVSHSPEILLAPDSKVINQAVETSVETVKEETGTQLSESVPQLNCSSYTHLTETAIDWDAETDEPVETKSSLNDSIDSLILEANMRDENNNSDGDRSDSSRNSSEAQSVKKTTTPPLQRVPMKRKLNDQSNEENIQRSKRLTILADGQEFDIEKRLLIEQSEVFAKSLIENESIKGVEVNGVDKETMTLVIKWMLKKSIKNLDSQAQSLYVAAKILGISRLKEECVESLIRTCRGENLVSHFIFCCQTRN